MPISYTLFEKVSFWMYIEIFPEEGMVHSQEERFPQSGDSLSKL